MTYYDLIVNSQSIDLSFLNKNFRNLKVIDSFTMLFKNENELKEYLIKKGLVKSSTNNTISHISYNRKYKKSLNIFYENHGVLFNPKSLLDTYNKLSFKFFVLAKDKDFLREFCDYIKYNSEVGEFAVSLGNLISSGDEFIANSFLLSNIFERLVKDRKKDDFSYKKLRDLCDFVYEYSKKTSKKDKKVIENNPEEFVEPEYEQLTFL